MKKLSLILLLLIFMIYPLNIKALSLDKNNLTLEKEQNETIDLYVNADDYLTEVNFSLVYTTYDVPAYFNVASGLKDEVNGIKHKITFEEPVTGKIKLGSVKVNVVKNPNAVSGTINIHSAKALTTNGENIILDSQTINVSIKKTNTDSEEELEKPTDSNVTEKNLLEKIESNIVNIELKEDIYEYKIKIKKNVEELDLKPIAKNEKYRVNITSQKISELENNEITITIESDKIKEEYKIKVNIIEDIEKIEIDEEEFESTFKYKGKWTVLIIILTAVLLVGLFLNNKNR